MIGFSGSTPSIPSGVTVDYVSKGSAVVLAGQKCFTGEYTPTNQPGQGPMSTFCAQLGALYRDRLPDMLPNPQLVGAGRPSPPGLRWPGERVGLAYDAVGLFLRAAGTPTGYDARRLGPFTPSPSSVGQQLRDITDSQHDPQYSTATASFNFRASRVAEDRELAILQVNGLRYSTEPPTCVYLIRGDRSGSHCPAVQR
jgi:hypothetical protein